MNYGWSRYRANSYTVYLSRGRVGFELCSDSDGDWYISAESCIYLSAIESIYAKSNRIILYFYDGASETLWL